MKGLIRRIFQGLARPKGHAGGLRIALYIGAYHAGDAMGRSVGWCRDALAAMGCSEIRIYCSASSVEQREVHVVPELDGLLADAFFQSAALHIFAFGGAYEIFDAIRFIGRHSRSVVYYHGITPVELGGNKMAAWRTQNQKTNLLAADAVCCASAYSAAGLQAFGVKQERLHIVPLPVAFTPRVVPPRMADGVVNLLTVGRLVQNKGALDALKALAICTQAGVTNFRLHIAGDRNGTQPDYVAAMDALITAEGLDDKVVFVGNVNDDVALARHYAWADAVLLPSYHDSYCLPVLEAFVHGRPVVGYASSNMPAISNGYARLVTTGDVTALAVGVRETIEGLTMPVPQFAMVRGVMLLADYQQAVTAFARQFDVDSFAAGMRHAVHQVLTQPAYGPVAKMPEMRIDASALFFRPVYREPDNDIVRGDGSVYFDAARMEQIGEGVLFFGPAVPLQPGRYTLVLDAVIAGHFQLRLTDDQGRLVIDDRIIDQQMRVIHFTLHMAALRFEIVLLRVPTSRYFRMVKMTLAPSRIGDVVRCWIGEARARRTDAGR